MRVSILGLGLLAFMGLAAPAEARPAARPWCAFLNDMQVNECFYWTFEQCQETVFGVGGFCYENPFYEPPPQKVVKQRRKKRR